MIRSNLSTRPFYNEHAVRMWLLAALVVVVAATVFNVVKVIRYSRSDTQLATEASQNEARAAELRRRAAQLRGTVDPKQLDVASTDARQANDLIDRRTFSWTELLNIFETTLPDQVRLTAVRPKLDPRRGIVLTINVVARSIEDVNLLMENFEGTGAFRDLLPAEEHFNDQGQLEATLEGTYIPTTGGGAKQP